MVGQYTVVDRKKVGHGCNDIDEGLELGKQKIKKVFALSDVPNFAEIYAKSKKKRSSPHKFPAFRKYAIGCEQQIKGLPCHSIGR